MIHPMLKISDYVTLVLTVPETHADAVREAMSRAGAGESEHYAGCSFSVKGIGRFQPKKGARPFIGKEDSMEEVAEERIETICAVKVLEDVIAAIKQAHPYQETVIDIFPIYTIAIKK